MSASTITVTGNLTSDPELRYTPSGAPVASFSVAVNERYRDQSGEWKDGNTSFFRANCWRDLAEHVAESLSKGDRVIVHGVMKQRQYEAKDGTKRDAWEIQADSIGPDLRYATAKVSRVRRDQAPVPEDPWVGRNGGPRDEDAPQDEPPF